MVLELTTFTSKNKLLPFEALDKVDRNAKRCSQSGRHNGLPEVARKMIMRHDTKSKHARSALNSQVEMTSLRYGQDEEICCINKDSTDSVSKQNLTSTKVLVDENDNFTYTEAEKYKKQDNETKPQHSNQQPFFLKGSNANENILNQGSQNAKNPISKSYSFQKRYEKRQRYQRSEVCTYYVRYNMLTLKCNRGICSSLLLS